MEEETNGEGKRGKYLDEENNFLAEEKKNEEGKGGKHLEKEDMFWQKPRKTDKEKDDFFGIGNFFGGRKEEWRRKRRKISWRRKIAAEGTDGTDLHAIVNKSLNPFKSDMFRDHP